METLDILKPMKEGFLKGIFFNIRNVEYWTELINPELYKEEC